MLIPVMYDAEKSSAPVGEPGTNLDWGLRGVWGLVFTDSLPNNYLRTYYKMNISIEDYIVAFTKF